MAIDHRGQTLKVGSFIEILPIRLFKTGLGWYRKIAKLRKHTRTGTVLAVMANGDLSFRGADGLFHLIPSRYVLKIA